MPRPGACCAAFILLALVSHAHGDELLDRVALSGESANAGRQLEAVRKLVTAKKWADAITEYQLLVENSGDELVPLAPEHAIAVRWLVHADIARLPAEARKLYRDRVDLQAGRWLEQGTSRNDQRLLERVPDDAFCSTPTARALDLLGNRAFECGGFDEARRWWRLLAGPVIPGEDKDAKPLELVYPDAPDDIAAVQAKQVLALIFKGDRRQARKEVETFAARYPKTDGNLAGRKGRLADTLKVLLDSPDASHPPAHPDSWPTFAGDSSRQHAASGDIHGLARMCKDGPRWRFDLDKRTALPTDNRKTRNSVANCSQLAFHPIIVGDHVVVNDGRRITAYGITTGELKTWYDLQEEAKLKLPNVELPAPPYLRFTLSAGDGYIVARLGAQAIAEPNGSGSVRDTVLVCLRQKPNFKGQRLCWTVHLQPKNAEAYFEGTPIVHDGRVYAVTTTYSGAQAIAHVHCYALDADSESAAPAPLLWKQELCNVKEDRSDPRYRHHLLTLAGRNLVYASHSGAVIAIDGLTGRHMWARRYQSRGPKMAPDRPTRRDLGSCLYADGRVYVAPLDDNRLLCLDPATGNVIWEKHDLEVVDLLGILGGRLIFTVAVISRATPGDTAETQLRAIDPATGDTKGGWTQPSDGGGVSSFGRGLFFGGNLLWPTTAGVCVVRIEDGESVYEPMVQCIRRGNLAYATGCLAVAELGELSLYVSAARLKGEEEEQVRRDPKSPETLLRLAADDGTTLTPEQSLAGCLQILHDAKSREVIVEKSHGIGVTAGSLAVERITELAKAAPGSIAPQLDEQARQVLKDGTGDRTKLLQRVADECPGSGVVTSLLPELALLYEKAADWGAAARTYRLQLQHETDNTRHAVALARLAFCYEKQQAWQAARSCWLRLSEEAGDRKIPDVLPGDKTAREFVAAHLKQAEFGEPAANPVAYATSWHVELESAERCLDCPEHPDQRLSAEWLTREARELKCREMKSGKLRWRAEFATDTHWYERYLDLFVVGSPAAILGVSIADGKVVWQVACADNRARFSGFQFVDGRLYCLHGLSRVMAVDAASGRILWIAHAPRARQVLTELQAGFLPCYLATADLVLIYSEFGTVLALDAASGRVKAELQPVGIVASQGLPSVPLLFPAAKVIVLALDQDHVIAIDFVTGAERWRSTLPFGANRVGAWPTLARAGGQSNEVVVASHLNFGFLAQQLDARTGKPSTVKDGRVATIDQTVSPPSRRLDPRAARLKFEVLLFSLECTMEPVNAAGGFNLSVHDEKTGKLSQRLDLHAERSPMFESFNLELRPSWRLQASQLPAPTAMTIYCGSDGMMVSRGRNVWRLIPKPTP